MTVGANNDKLWTNFCTQVLAKPQLLDDPRFKTLPARLENIDALQDEIEQVFVTQPTSHWVPKLDAAAVPGGPVYTYDQALADPHVAARNMVVEVDHPRIGRMKNMGSPVKSSGEFTSIRAAAPWLGQHSEQVLKNLGMADAEIEALFAQKVVYDRYRGQAG